MVKRSVALVTGALMIGSMLIALPAQAQEGPAEVPETVQIDDPFGDANLLNDQGNSGTVGQQGDNVTPVDVGSSSDIGKVWFTNDGENVSVHIQTEVPPPATQGLRFDVYTAPGEGSVANSTLGCVRFVAVIGGKTQGQNTTWQGPDTGKIFDACNEGTHWFNNGAEIELIIGELGDGTGLVTMTAPLGSNPFLETGKVLTATTVAIRVAYGEAGSLAGSAIVIDNTKPGTDYTIGSGGDVVDKPKDKVKKDKKAKKTKKLKAKKKKKKKKKKAAPSCPAYTPGEEGAEAETVVVTDAATEEKPVELEFTAPAGGGNDLGLGVYDETASLYQNIQVDTTTPDTGLYVRYEFPDRHDYDLYLNYPDGSTAANSGDFNVAPGEGLGGGSPDGGWEAGTNYEQVMGIRTADCAGYTARLVSYLTTGGATKLLIWVGEATADPVPPEGDQQSAALAFFYGLLLGR